MRSGSRSRGATAPGRRSRTWGWTAGWSWTAGDPAGLTRRPAPGTLDRSSGARSMKKALLLAGIVLSAAPFAGAQQFQQVGAGLPGPVVWTEGVDVLDAN